MVCWLRATEQPVDTMVAPASRAKAMERANFMGFPFLVGDRFCSRTSLLRAPGASSGVATARHQQGGGGQGGTGGQGHQNGPTGVVHHIVCGGATVGVDLLAQAFA